MRLQRDSQDLVTEQHSLFLPPQNSVTCAFIFVLLKLTGRFFPPTSSHSLTQNGVLQVNAILSLATWSSSRPHRYKSSVPQDCPHFRCQLQELHPKLPVFCRFGYKVRGSHNPLSLNARIIYWKDSQHSGKMLYLLLQLIRKDTKKQADEDTESEVQKGGKFRGLCLGGVECKISWHVDGFTNSEPLQKPSLKGFYRHDFGRW